MNTLIEKFIDCSNIIYQIDRHNDDEVTILFLTDTNVAGLADGSYYTKNQILCLHYYAVSDISLEKQEFKEYMEEKYNITISEVV